VVAGRCLCGGVKFEIEGDLAGIQVCHCSECRRAQGSAFGTNLPVAAGQFRLICGADLLKAYESSPGKDRVFCSTCGSPVYSRLHARPDRLRIRAGLLDDSADLALAFHFHTDSRANWWPITDDLTQYPEDRPAD